MRKNSNKNYIKLFYYFIKLTAESNFAISLHPLFRPQAGDADWKQSEKQKLQAKINKNVNLKIYDGN